jgi:hypothetical protein
MEPKSDDLLARLSAGATRERRKSELEEFIEFIVKEGSIASACPSAVTAEGYNIDRHFRPEGGLTREHFDALAEVDPIAGALLAQAVVENMLLKRGFPAMPIHWAAKRLGSEYWERLAMPEDFELASSDVELEYHRQKEEEPEERRQAAKPDESKINPHGDWSVVVASHGTFTLPPVARKVVAVLFREHLQGRPVHKETVRREAGLYSDRIDHSLRQCKAWGKLVRPVPGRRGFWELRL